MLILCGCSPSEHDSSDLAGEGRLPDDLQRFVDDHRRVSQTLCDEFYPASDPDHEVCLWSDPIRVRAFPGPVGGCYEVLASESRVWAEVFREAAACLDPHLARLDACLRETPESDYQCFMTYKDPAEACVDTLAFDAMWQERSKCGRCDIDYEALGLEPPVYCTEQEDGE